MEKSSLGRRFRAVSDCCLERLARKVIGFPKIQPDRYEIVPAVTAAQKQTAQELRAAVFCHEKGFEKLPPGIKLEQDAHDAHATHLLLWDHREKKAIGCARLIHPGIGAEGQILTLPMAHTCQKGGVGDVLSSVRESGQSYAEVSRLLLLPSARGLFSRGLTEGVPPLLTLFMGVQACAEHQGVAYQVALVEKRLLMTLEYFGAEVGRLGPPVEHRGQRHPIVMETDQLAGVAKERYPRMYERIHHEISFALSKHEPTSEPQRAPSPRPEPGG